ncbi:MAG: 50S ribosomal protein L22 [Candidatus Nealsonbacteria bacterium]|nr:50S ribosomal protein L22 [Candidatus Nealsonbacteria bacterium]
MRVAAKLRYLRIAPRKVRLVADLIRGKTIEEAQAALNFTVKKAAKPLLRLLNSAIANAKNNFQLDPANLYILSLSVDEGPKTKRWMPRARGSAYEIQKKVSHVNLVLEEIKKSKGVKTKIVEEKKVSPTVTEQVEKPQKTEKPKLKPRLRQGRQAGKAEGAIRKIFRRQVF